MNRFSKVAKSMLLASAIVCFASAAWAACSNSNRPGTPAFLRASYGTVGGAFLLTWVNTQTRTGLTYYDIFIRGENGRNLGRDIVGGAGQQSVAGRFGSYSFRNMPPSPVYTFSMRARTKAGTQGCVSLNTSGAVTISPFHPVGQAPF